MTGITYKYTLFVFNFLFILVYTFGGLPKTGAPEDFLKEIRRYDILADSWSVIAISELSGSDIVSTMISPRYNKHIHLISQSQMKLGYLDYYIRDRDWSLVR